MIQKETISWILDCDLPQGLTFEERAPLQEEQYRQNIEFVHSLGLKCDCVGWSNLDLSDPRADEILAAIEAVCKERGWKARCYYERTYTDFESDWYELNTEILKGATVDSFLDVPGEQGEPVTLLHLRAYHEMKSTPKWTNGFMLVPDRFRQACVRHQISDLDFCWAEDVGKYKAEQYFHVYGNRQIPEYSGFSGWDITEDVELGVFGGYLPRISEIFYRIQYLNLPDCYLKAHMPNCNVAVAYRRKTNYSIRSVLIHKRFAEILISEKVLPRSALSPALVLDRYFDGYEIYKTERENRPTAAYMEASMAAYEKLSETPRPIRKRTEKEALKLMRSAKKERKEEFQKGMSKAKAESLCNTPNGIRYAPLFAYYAIANGGSLSDEYKLLPFEAATKENEDFFERLQAEELLLEKPNGVVFANCPDGDAVLLCENGSVIRFSHEEPTVTALWESLPLFVAEAITEES